MSLPSGATFTYILCGNVQPTYPTYRFYLDGDLKVETTLKDFLAQVGPLGCPNEVDLFGYSTAGFDEVDLVEADIRPSSEPTGWRAYPAELGEKTPRAFYLGDLVPEAIGDVELGSFEHFFSVRKQVVRWDRISRVYVCGPSPQGFESLEKAFEHFYAPLGWTSHKRFIIRPFEERFGKPEATS